MENLTLKQAKDLLKSGKITATELTKYYLDRIEKIDPKVDAYLTITKEEALKKAEEIDKKGDFSAPLAGIPIALKDVVSTKGIRTTAGSKILENYIPPFSAVVWERLEEAGAILLGKVNTDEFTMGSSCENSAFKPTKNPWDLTRVPGGSSGGSAAAVRADECVFAIGTDTGGSIRQPANFCACVGLKVTYGRVPRYGVIPYASSFDTIGPLTKTVEDAALVAEVIAGHSEKDATTPQIEVPKYSEGLQNSIKGKKIGLPKEYFEEKGLDENIKKQLLDTAHAFAQETGAEIKEISLPLTEYAIPAYYILAKSEASTNLARYDGVRFGHKTEEAHDLKEFYEKTREQGFGPEVKRAIMMGTFTLSAGYFDAYYKKAARVRSLIKQDFEKAFKEVDVIFAPVSPFSPFKLGEKLDDPLQMYLADIFTVTANLAGIPGLAVPTGLVNNLPTGLQIFGKQFAEQDILNFGWHLEKFVNFQEKPNL